MNYIKETPNSRRSSRGWIIFLITALLASVMDIVASSLLRNPNLGTTARLSIALLPLPGDIALIVLVLLRIRKLDDFQKCVHFEAVTVAFLSTGVAVFVYGYLQKAHLVGSLSAALVWAFMLLFYAVGYLIAASHYR
jgi:hypothetical protein